MATIIRRQRKEGPVYCVVYQHQGKQTWEIYKASNSLSATEIKDSACSAMRSVAESKPDDAWRSESRI